MKNKSVQGKAVSGILYKIFEKLSVNIVSLIVSILLARMIDPSDYGVIAMANVVITVLSVFVNCGLGTALIHKKSADETDISTCFWASLILSVVMYIGLFFCAPIVAAFFEMDLLTSVIRVLGLQVILAMIHSVQTALIAKKFMYQQYFYISLVSSIMSGAVGVGLAFYGAGIWSLVMQSLVSIGCAIVFSGVILRWMPTAVFSRIALKEQCLYSWRLLVVGVVDCIYAELRDVVVTKKYSSTQLAYYSKGAQFPKLISNTVNQSIISVLFPVMSMIQDDREQVRKFVKRSVSVLSFVLFPVMFGLMALSEELVVILLTEKWKACVPYMKVLCLAYLCTPIQSVYKQAMKAMNQTELLVKINLVEKGVGLLLLLILMPYGVEAICWSFVFYHIVGLMLCMFSGKQVVGDSIRSQISDLAVNVLGALIMWMCMYISTYFPLAGVSMVLFKVLIGAVVYLAVAIVIKNPNVVAIKEQIIDALQRSK